MTQKTSIAAAAVATTALVYNCVLNRRIKKTTLEIVESNDTLHLINRGLMTEIISLRNELANPTSALNDDESKY